MTYLRVHSIFFYGRIFLKGIFAIDEKYCYIVAFVRDEERR